MASQDPFELKFTSREVSACGGLALLKRMLDGLGFKAAMQSWDLPQPGCNRGYAAEQLIEQHSPPAHRCTKIERPNKAVSKGIQC